MYLKFKYIKIYIIVLLYLLFVVCVIPTFASECKMCFEIDQYYGIGSKYGSTSGC